MAHDILSVILLQLLCIEVGHDYEVRADDWWPIISTQVPVAQTFSPPQHTVTQNNHYTGSSALRQNMKMFPFQKSSANYDLSESHVEIL